MTSNAKIQLSIAVVTRNRPESLSLALSDLREQSAQPYEIIVADDSDTSYQDAVRAIAERWQAQYLPGARSGLYANRNKAALACSGTHIRTMDDDHRLPANHLSACLDAVDSDPHCLWTIGENFYLDGRYRSTAQRANQLHPSGLGCAVSDPNDNWAVADGSTIYPASVFGAGHRFVEYYAYGSSYLEFGAYLYRHGVKSRCLEGTLVDHYGDQATLNRLTDADFVGSQFFSSICFNLYFQPNSLLACKYFLACWRQSPQKGKFLGDLPLTLARARQRWEHA